MAADCLTHHGIKIERMRDPTVQVDKNGTNNPVGAPAKTYPAFDPEKVKTILACHKDVKDCKSTGKSITPAKPAEPAKAVAEAPKTEASTVKGLAGISKAATTKAEQAQEAFKAKAGAVNPEGTKALAQGMAGREKAVNAFTAKAYPAATTPEQAAMNSAAARGTLSVSVAQQLASGRRFTRDEIATMMYQRGKELGLPEEVIKTAIGTTSRESNFNPFIKNPTSSAYGLGQYIKSTWNSQCAKAGTSCNRNDVLAQMDTLYYDVNARYQKYIAFPSINSRYSFAQYDYVNHYVGSWTRKSAVNAQRFDFAIGYANRTAAQSNQWYAYAAARATGGDYNNILSAANARTGRMLVESKGGGFMVTPARAAGKTFLTAKPLSYAESYAMNGSTAAIYGADAPMSAPAGGNAFGGVAAPAAVNPLPTVSFNTLSDTDKQSVLQQWAGQPAQGIGQGFASQPVVGIPAPSQAQAGAATETFVPEMCRGQNAQLGTTGLLRGSCMVTGAL